MSGYLPAAQPWQSALVADITQRRVQAGPEGQRAQRTALTAYAAFRERHYESYLQYAGLRIGQRGAAEAAVDAAFTELAVSWTVLLGSAGPAAAAWRILHNHINRALGLGATTAPASRVVQTLQQDAHLLHQRMHLTHDRIAEVLGVRPGDVLRLLPRSAGD
ncbi:hypothetical protein ACIP6V_09700 [Streptomyces sp. NPDC088770]|uniref:hypothetical protein n=1 Tax=unclassified Streptomyces TaxID=2593676 RepID=UPI003811FB12